MLQVVKNKTQHDHMKNLEKEMQNATTNVKKSCFDEYIDGTTLIAAWKHLMMRSINGNFLR
jgi:hypothetical protein